MNTIQVIRVTAEDPSILDMWTPKNLYKRVIEGEAFMLRKSYKGDGGAIIGKCIIGKKIITIINGELSADHKFMKNHNNVYKKKLGKTNNRRFPLIYYELKNVEIFDQEIMCNNLTSWTIQGRLVQKFHNITSNEYQTLITEN